MRGSRSLIVASVLIVLVAQSQASGQRADTTGEIVGTWRGSSACVDRQAAPACTDEQVVYDIAATPGKPDTITVKADKIVDGKRVPMGVLDFSHDAKSGSWTTEIETPRVHALWRLQASGTTLVGSMTLLPSKAVVRRINLRKAP